MQFQKNKLDISERSNKLEIIQIPIPVKCLIWSQLEVK